MIPLLLVAVLDIDFTIQANVFFKIQLSSSLNEHKQIRNNVSKEGTIFVEHSDWQEQNLETGG